MNEVAVQKIISIQRCAARAREAHREAGEGFASNFNLQDAAILNIVRACETALDLANMVIRQRRLGIPAESRESFQILAREGLIPTELSQRLQAMVGFRNLAVYQYRQIDLAIVEAILRKDLDDVLAFASAAQTLIDA